MDPETIIQLISAGYTAYQVAKEFGVTPSYIRQVYREYTQPRDLQPEFEAAMDPPAGAALGRRGGYKRKKMDDSKDNGFFTGQRVVIKDSYGRKKSSVAALRKLQRRDTEYRIERFGSCQPLNLTTGAAYPLSFNTVAGTTNLPMYMFDLTIRDSNGATQLLNTAWRPYINDASMNLDFSAINGTDNDGTSARLYPRLIKANTSNPTTGVSAPTGVLQYSDVKLGLRAPYARAGYFDILLVQILEEALLPGTGINSARNGWYQAFIKDYTYNPIFKAVTGTRKDYGNIKILKRWRRQFSPDSKDNWDGNGQTIQMNLFMNHNRYCQFRATAAERYANMTQFKDNAVNDQIDNEYTYNYLPNHRGRLYLWVLGTHYDSALTTDVFDPSIQPSFDIEIRNKWVYDTPYY